MLQATIRPMTAFKCMASALILLVTDSLAWGQATSPLTVTGTTSSKIQLIKSNAPAATWDILGGDSSFFISKASSNFIRVDAGGPTEALHIDQNGRVGIHPGFTGTTLQRMLHLIGADPAIRFQDTTGGTGQLFDIEAGTQGFNIVDATNSNRIPFTIFPGAPTNSLFIDSDGSIGLGTENPTTLLHAHRPAQAMTAEILARFDISDDAVGKLEISNVSSTDGIFHPRFRGTTALQATPLTLEGAITDDVGSNPIVTFAGTKLSGGSIVNRPLVVFRNNQTVKARVAANGDIFATSFNPTSSRATKDRIVDLDGAKAQEAIQKLNPVEYVYKDDATGEKRVGFIAEDVPEIVANADRQTVPIMDVLALVTRVVKDQQQIIDDQKKTLASQQNAINAQQSTIEELSNRLIRLESKMRDK